MKKYDHLIHTIYIVMSAFLLFGILWAIFFFKGPTLREELVENNASLADGWTLADGSAADLLHLQNLAGTEPYQENSVYYTLPEKETWGNASLCFRSKNIYYSVYVDGELRYTPYVEENAVYANSLGTRWNFIPLLADDAGKVVEIRFMTVYDNATACIDHVVLGLAGGQIMNIIAEKAVAVITAGLIILLGIFLMIMDIPVNTLNNKNHELLYLGEFALVIGFWCLAETNIIQFISGDSRMIQLMSCGLLSLFPIPLMLYLNAAFELKRSWILGCVCGISILQYLVCTILHFTGVLDIHETLTMVHVVVILSAAVVAASILRNSLNFRGEQKKTLYQFLRGSGLVIVSVTSIIDVIRYYQRTGGDNAQFMRIGLFLFIACFGGSSMEKTIEAVRKGSHMDFVSQLAYMDGLTGIGNRTAFQEKMEELENKKQELKNVGIVIFDVNNLKKVNDVLGHNEGDQMIRKSAEVIKNTFYEERGECYRIGGDEFVVILLGDRIAERCDNAIRNMHRELDAYNMEGDKKYDLNIAGGYAVYNEDGQEMTLMEIFESADSNMYENKKKMKNNSCVSASQMV